MPYFKLRVDRSGAEISRTSDFDSETKSCYTSGYPLLRPPLPKTKNKNAQNKNARKEKTREKKKTNIYSDVYTERLIKHAVQCTAGRRTVHRTACSENSSPNLSHQTHNHNTNTNSSSSSSSSPLFLANTPSKNL